MCVPSRGMQQFHGKRPHEEQVRPAVLHTRVTAQSVHHTRNGGERAHRREGRQRDARGACKFMRCKAPHAVNMDISILHRG